MNVKFRDLSVAAAKLKTNGQAAAQTYAANAKAAAGDWATNTGASGDAWTAGVQGAISRNGFVHGVTKAGAGKYGNAIDAKGQSRFSDGIGKAGPAWQAGFGPIAAAVAGTNIGPRGARGSQQNKDRAAAMADAFRKASGRAA